MKDEVVLSIRKDRCSDTVINGVPCVHVHTGMTAPQLIEMLLKFTVSDDKVGVVIEHE